MEEFKISDKAKKNKLWFRRKTYGLGWTPITWQGWSLVAVYLVLLTLLGILLLPHSGEELGIVYSVAFGLLFISLTSFLIGISYLKGEPPKWQWGSDKISSNNAVKRRAMEEKTVPRTVRGTKKKGN